ncbi:ABC transporter substrate-binding protein [Paenibacillus sp. 32352]|uniref:ABC transporter substrate-binding protein n=1 Tax=Paenibacillus sp. 32352 TaxID=1969111 RepID=UPI00117FBBBB|nr:ABC transporter substrate-binding protein [Paenibacillus sp. 32352]
MKALSKWLMTSLVLIIAAGCSVKAILNSGNASTESQPAADTMKSSPAPDQKGFMSFKDDIGRTIDLKTQPKRIIVLSPQLLDLLYAVDGSAIAKTTSPSAAVPEQAKGIEDVGGMTTVNTEKLLALKPDLVIGSTSFHRELANVLDASGIPFALFSLSTYQDLKEKAPLFGQLAGKPNRANEELAKLDEKIKLLTANLPDQKPTFIMLNVTPTSISVQRTNTVGLEVAGMLKMKNVAEALDASSKSQSTAPYSLEKVVELNPDYLFILIHGARGDGEKKIKSELAAQPVWSSLRAVKENHMTVLPSDLLLSNPGFRLNESVAYLAEYVYPEIYKNAK